MNKNTILHILLFFLVVVNGFFLFNYLGRPIIKGPMVERDPGDFIVRALKFDDAQMQKLQILNSEHRQRMREINDDLKELKDALFSKISEESLNTELIDSLTNSTGFLEKEKEMETFFHLRDIQSLCNEKQKERFNKIVLDALRKNGPLGQNRPPPRN